MKKFIPPPLSNKRLISTLMSSRSSVSRENSDFVLKSSSEFASRSGDVFGKLQTLEKHHETWISENETIECFDESNNLDTEDSQFKKLLPEFQHSTKSCSKKPKNESSGKNCEFKRPLPIQQCKRKAPTHFKRKTHKWIKYSLEDIPVSSDATNTAVALQFINEIRMNKDTKPDINEKSEKIVFNKPIRKELRANVNMNIYESFNLVSSTKQSTKMHTTTESKPKNLNVKLAHLQDDYD